MKATDLILIGSVLGLAAGAYYVATRGASVSIAPIVTPVQTQPPAPVAKAPPQAQNLVQQVGNFVSSGAGIVSAVDDILNTIF